MPLKTTYLNRYTKTYVIVCFFVIGFIVFFKSLFDKFVLDDNSQILANPLIRSLSNIPNFFLGSSFSNGKHLVGLYYKPFMTVIFSLLYNFFGQNPIPFHALQVILHIVNSILVFNLLRKFFKSSISFFLSLIFLTHPINVEAVVYSSNLQDVLFFFFGTLSLLIISAEKLKFKNYALYILCLFFSLLSKETGILFLFLAPIFRYCLQKRIERKLIIYSIFILIVYLLLHLSAVGFSNSIEKPFPIQRVPFSTRLYTIPSIVFYYIKTFFWPEKLAVVQMWIVNNLSLENFYIPLFLDTFFFSIILGLGFYIKKTSDNIRIFLLFLTWFLIGLGAHIQILPLDATVADRWFYFPIVGLLGLIGISIIMFGEKISANYKEVLFKNIKVLSLVVGIILIITLSVRSVIRISNWNDGLTLARHDILINQNSFALENNFAFELMNSGNYKDALMHARKSVNLAPWWWLNWDNLGKIYRHIGDYKNTKASFDRSISNTKVFYDPYENLADLLLFYYSPQHAEDFIVKTGRHLSLSKNLWLTFAFAEYKLGKLDKAKQAALNAYNLDSSDTRSELFYNAIISNKHVNILPPKY